jgi:NAD(P)-dependent dehydrogenase (short-subunit alcohol dehydrogenase family)
MLEARAGSVVNVSSEAGIPGSAAGAAYTASKHAVVGLTKNSAVIYGPKGLRVNAVVPGPTSTGIVANFGSQMAAERLGAHAGQFTHSCHGGSARRVHHLPLE